MRKSSPFFFTTFWTTSWITSWIVPLALLLLSGTASARLNTTEMVQKTAENQIRRLLEPLLSKYCHDECKLMSVNTTVDIATQEKMAPGFDDIELRNPNELAPSAAKVKILIDDKVGPVSRAKLLDLIQQYLDTLDFPVRLDTQVTHFPAPQGSESKVAELREKVSKEFLSTLDDLIRQFCPQQCLLADFNLQTEVVNGEEAQYGVQGEFYQDGDTAIRIKGISATLLTDETLLPEEQNNVVEMAKLKTNSFRNVTVTGKSLRFPHPVSFSTTAKNRGLASESDKNDNDGKKTSSNESNNKQEKIEKIEKIERVENGDAVQAELQKFKVFGLIFGISILALLIFIALSSFRSPQSGASSVHRIIQNLTNDPVSQGSFQQSPSTTRSEASATLSKRYEAEKLFDELISIYAQQPKVAKHVFSRILTEEGVETTAQCVHLFGEGIVIEMLRDPSLQTDLTELMEFYVRNTIELADDEKLELLQKLHNRTIVGKLMVLGNPSSNLFDFLAEMDGQQVMELIRTESLTVKSIVLTQCDAQKRAAIYAQMDPEIRLQLLAELSRIDYLPKDFIFNVAAALKRKKRDNPKLNTEALPGSDVLVSLLERTGQIMQKTVVKNLEMTNPESARTVKSKLVSLDTLRYLRDGQLLEVVLSLRYDELIQFLRGAPDDIRKLIFSKAPKELVTELESEVAQTSVLSRENYQTFERKVLNRMKILANEGQINLIETNERMFSDTPSGTPFVEAVPGGKPLNNDLRRGSA